MIYTLVCCHTSNNRGTSGSQRPFVPFIRFSAEGNYFFMTNTRNQITWIKNLQLRRPIVPTSLQQIEGKHSWCGVGGHTRQRPCCQWEELALCLDYRSTNFPSPLSVCFCQTCEIEPLSDYCCSTFNSQMTDLCMKPIVRRKTLKRLTIRLLVKKRNLKCNTITFLIELHHNMG